MPYKIPKKRKILRTITMTNGSKITGELGSIDNNPKVYWFKDGKYITPEQQERYRFYDKNSKIYRKLDSKLNISKGSVTPVATTRIFTPNLDALEDYVFRDKIHNTPDQSIPVKNHNIITLRTKGKMNLVDIPENLLDSIAVNSGRTNTDFFTNMGLIGKESTFGGFSKTLYGDDITKTYLNPYSLTNNHSYFISPEEDYLQAVIKKYNINTEEGRIKAEKNVEYAKTHGLIKEKTPHYSDYILADAFKRYETAPDKYNKGQSNYVPMVNAIRQELIEEKQLQNYWNTRGKSEYARGKKEGIKRSLEEGGK